MKKLLKLILAVALALGLAAGASYLHEGTPYLKGKCYVFTKSGIKAAILAVTEKPDQDGKKVLAYAVLLQRDFFAVPAFWAVRQTNEDHWKLLNDGTIVELDCKTGAPLGGK